MTIVAEKQALVIRPVPAHVKATPKWRRLVQAFRAFHRAHKDARGAKVLTLGGKLHVLAKTLHPFLPLTPRGNLALRHIEQAADLYLASMRGSDACPTPEEQLWHCLACARNECDRALEESS